MDAQAGPQGAQMRGTDAAAACGLQTPRVFGRCRRYGRRGCFGRRGVADARVSQALLAPQERVWIVRRQPS